MLRQLCRGYGVPEVSWEEWQLAGGVDTGACQGPQMFLVVLQIMGKGVASF